jgi:superfamily I DNA/RNA helicase
MMELENNGDKRSVYAMYVKFYEALQDRRLLTSDQLLNDFLNYLESFAWNHRRLSEGYDLIFADEFHLFNMLERHVLRYLSREVTSYPRIFMAIDPRQSPWDVYFADVDAQGTTGSITGEDELEPVKTVDIPTVHRSSPQVWDLIKHIHLDYANLNLDEDWDYSISAVKSLGAPGPKPSLFVTDTSADEETAIYKAVRETYSQAHSGAQLALALIDAVKAPNQGVRRRGALSLLYLAVSRASREVRLFANEDFGGVPEVLSRAREEGVLGIFRG